MQALLYTSNNIVSPFTLLLLQARHFYTTIKMSKIESVLTDKAPKPLPQFSQAIKHNGLVFCSGNIGLDPATSVAIEGTVKDRTVCLPCPLCDQYRPEADDYRRGNH